MAVDRKQFLIELAESIRAAVRPSVMEARGSKVLGKGIGGDVTFQVDKVAEDCLEEFVRGETCLAYYSEDRGFITVGNGSPEFLLIVDPIDGSRNAMNGFEGCVVAIALAEMVEAPRLKNVSHGLVREIVGDKTFLAQRGQGAEILERGKPLKPRLSEKSGLDSAAWSLTVPGRPARLVFGVMADLIDRTSLCGGFFACNSTSFSLTRLLTGQLDAYVDVANRVLRDVPETEPEFRRAGNGSVVGICSYDIAAAAFIVQEAGAIITDAYGNGLEDMPLVTSDVSALQSCVAAGNKTIHGKILEYIDERLRRGVSAFAPASM